MNPSIESVAAWLLGRPLVPEDGTPEPEIAAAEQRLGLSAPTALQAFYRGAGRVEALTGSFQSFAPPSAWQRFDDKLLFLEENQGVCWWAADADGRVFQTVDLETPEWHPEPSDLTGFLHLVLHYQMAQGGYPFAGMISQREFGSLADVEAFVARMEAKPVVDESGLRIAVAGEQVLVWYLHDGRSLTDPGLFLSALDASAFDDLCDRWGFEDLG